MRRFQGVDWRSSFILSLVVVSVWLNLERVSDRSILITGRLSDSVDKSFPEVRYEFDIRLGSQQLRLNERGECSALVASLRHYSVWVPRRKFPARVEMLRRSNGEFAAKISLPSSQPPSQAKIRYQFANGVERSSRWLRLVPSDQGSEHYSADGPHLSLTSVPRPISFTVPFRSGPKRLLPNLLYGEGQALAQMIHEGEGGAQETSELPPSFEDERQRLLRDLRLYAHRFSSLELDDHLEALRRLEREGAADQRCRAWSEVLSSMARQKAFLGKALGGEKLRGGPAADESSGVMED